MSKKDIEPMVSGAGFIAGLFTDLVTGVRIHGGSAEDIHRLTTPDGRMLMDDICKQIVNHAKPAVVETSNLDSIKWTLERDFRKERPNYDLRLIRNSHSNPDISFDNLRTVSIHKNGESSISLDEFTHRAQWVDYDLDLGQYHAEWILRNKHLIPKEWKDFHLVFGGTLWRDRFETNYSPCLIWGIDGELYLAFMPHSDKVGRKYRALRVVK